MKVVGIFNECSSQTIPFENFLRVNFSNGCKLAISLSQSTQQVLQECESFQHGGSVETIGLAEHGNLATRTRHLGQVLREHKPDVIHTHHALTAMLAAFIAKSNGYRTIVTVHNDFKRMKRRHQLMFLLAYRCANLVICNSQSTRRSISSVARRFFPEVPIQVIYNGVNIERVGLGEVRNWEGYTRRREPFRFVATARFVQQKDHETLVRAFAKLLRSGIPATLTLIGDGPLQAQIRSLVSALNLAKEVSFEGVLPRADVYKFLRESDAFLVTSRWEGFCNAMVEAAAAGLPVVASNIDTLTEVLGPENGVFFERGNSTDLAQAMRDVISKYDVAIRRAKSARNFVSSSYSLSRSANLHENIYEALAKSRPVMSA